MKKAAAMKVFVLCLAVVSHGHNRLSLSRSQAGGEPSVQRDRSPVDVLLTADEKHLITVNQTSSSISLVEVETGRVLAEAVCGNRPSAAALTPDGRRVLVSATFSGELTIFDLKDRSLSRVAAIDLGFEPRGVAVSPDGKWAYVALTTAHAIAVIDMQKLTEVGRIPVKRWPRYLALSPDGTRLAVGTSGDGGVSVVDTAARKLLYAEEFVGINLGQMEITRDGKHVYFPWMVYRHNPITPNNIRIGWVLASRLARVRLDGPARREAIALDPRGEAVSDPHGLALSPDETTVAVAASGTHEMLLFKVPGLPFQDYGGPGDHIDPTLHGDKSRFQRIDLGGRPMAIRYSKDGERIYVANYLLNAIQVVGVKERKVLRTMNLGGAEQPSMARRGEAIFYDGRRSLDQWYSCHTCHYEGHVNSTSMDTRNDGRFGNFKTVLSLRNVTKTGPWFWHGWEKNLNEAVRRSMTETMLGKPPSKQDVAEMIAFLETLKPPPNPYRSRDGKLSESAARGEVVFKSAKAGCVRCHSGEYFTDGKIHKAGLESPDDVYRGYNPPSLVGAHDRMLYMHDGRSRSLEEALKGPHNPSRVTGRGELTDDEMRDLIAYLRSL